MRPLADIRVLAVEQYGAGPFGSLQLASLGAEVIKIENPRDGGDVGRYVPPFNEGEDSLFFESLNGGKRSIGIDLADARGREVFEDLVRVSDAVYSNLRGDVPARLGLTYARLGEVNPAIVCCSLSGFGTSGPRASEPGYDYILQGMAGWMSITGEPDGLPTKSGVSTVDFSAGLAAALSLVAGVHAARRDGIGLDCDVSLLDTAIGMLSYLGTWHLSRNYLPQRMPRSSHPSLVPFGLFRAQDGWLVAGCAKEIFWQRLTRCLGREDLLGDARFQSFEDRMANREDLTKILDNVFAKRTVAEWVDLLGGVSVPCGPVNDVATALADPQVAHRGLILTSEHPRFGQIKHVRPPVSVGPHLPMMERAPRRGEDTARILRELLDYPAERVEQLLRSGSVTGPQTEYESNTRESSSIGSGDDA